MQYAETHEFYQVVLINEDIKKIIAVSRGIKVSAFNARFVAKKAGTAAAGFSVASEEIRRFSEALHKAMEGLNQTMYELVKRTADMRRLIKLDAYLTDAYAKSPSRELSSAIARKKVLKDSTDHTLQELRERLLTRVQRAAQLCQMGEAATRAARIEAVYGGGLAGALRHVGEEVERTVTVVRSTLLELALRMD